MFYFSSYYIILYYFILLLLLKYIILYRNFFFVYFDIIIAKSKFKTLFLNNFKIMYKYKKKYFIEIYKENIYLYNNKYIIKYI